MTSFVVHLDTFDLSLTSVVRSWGDADGGAFDAVAETVKTLHLLFQYHFLLRGEMGLRYVNHMKKKKIKKKKNLAYFIAFVIQVSVDM